MIIGAVGKAGEIVVELGGSAQNRRRRQAAAKTFAARAFLREIRKLRRGGAPFKPLLA